MVQYKLSVLKTSKEKGIVWTQGSQDFDVQFYFLGNTDNWVF